MGTIRLTLLGGFAASVDGADVPDTAWRLKKARELVKLLALARDHTLHREQVMDALWRAHGPSAAANNLNQALHVARRALEPAAIESKDGLLVLAADVDVDLFELAAAYARRAETAAAYRAALALYGGELLPENRYDDWVEDRRDDLAALAAELEDEAAALAPGGTFALPSDASSFVGRARELSELHALLRRTRMLTLSGTGGAGKTRLALELARGAQASYESGAVLVELGALSDSRLVPDAVAAALDIRALAAQEIADAVTDFLASRTLLLVLDNCEHVLAETASLADRLLRSAPGITILATSREPLRVAGEVIFRVPSLDIPDPEQALSPQQLLEYESVSLFVERAVAAEPGFTFDDAVSEDVTRICLRLDGLPLALELAAGRLGALSPAAIAERLDDRFRILRHGSHAAPTRQQTLLATLDWSHDLLAAGRSRALPPPCCVRRRVRSRGGRAGLCGRRARARRCRRRSRPVGREIARHGRRDLRGPPLSSPRDSAHVRARLARRGGRGAGPRRSACRLGARPGGCGARVAPGSIREAPNLRAALYTLLEDEACQMPCASALRCSPSGCGGSISTQAKRQFAAALEAVPDGTMLRVEALLAAASIDFRSGSIQHGIALGPRRARPRARDRRHRACVARAAAARRFGDRGRRHGCGVAAARAGPRACATGGLRRARGDRDPFARSRSLDLGRPQRGRQPPRGKR